MKKKAVKRASLPTKESISRASRGLLEPTPKRPAKAAKKAVKAPTGSRRATKAQPAPAAPLFDRVASILDAARASVVRAVNSRMVLAYWLIGREIVQDLQDGDERAAYGKRILADLSIQLTQRYGQGYSATNLRQFRQFYQAFATRAPLIEITSNKIYHALRDKSTPQLKTGSGEPKNPFHHASRDESRKESLGAVFSAPGAKARASDRVDSKSHPLGGFFDIIYPAGGSSAQHPPPFHPSLSWTHYRSLMQVEKLPARDFYETEAVASGWNTRELERQIHSHYYERLLLSKDKPGMIQEQRAAAPPFDPTSILKSSVVLEFLGLPDSPRLHESELEQAIMDNLQSFLLELGRGFCFVARQKRVLFEDDEFFIDLVFYNYLLKCFVLIDLKIGKLTHQDVGQMDSYLRLYEDIHKVPGDNPTLGLILCSEKNETIARYSMLQESEQLFASKYRLHLPTEEELVLELQREIQAIEERREK